MADILRVTTPLVNKNQIQNNRQPEPNIPFNLQDITKVTKTNPQEELLEQNNGLVEQESASVLLSQLKDPAAAVRFLRGIYLMQDIVRLLPVNNQTITKEIEQLFEVLLLHPEDIAAEMARQEHSSTSFKGELFNLLRQLSGQNRAPDMQQAVANLLKSLYSYSGRKDVLEAVANNLQHLSESLAPSKTLSGKLAALSQEFRSNRAEQSFASLKGEVLPLLKEVEGSILFSPKLAKVLSITVYNLSRFNDNPDFLQDAFSNLMLQLTPEQRDRLVVDLQRYLSKLAAGPQSGEAEGQGRPASGGEAAFAADRQRGSQIMDALTRIIGKQNEAAGASSIAADKVEKIIHSLLSSPCNYTPLLHFVVPVQLEEIKAFAEIWINPNGSEDRGETRDPSRCIHMLLAFDVEGLGQFEADLFADGDNLELTLLCPPPYVDAFANIPKRIAAATAGTGYRFGNIKIGSLERPRSLMEAFPSLPNKRTGLNVKI